MAAEKGNKNAEKWAFKDIDRLRGIIINKIDSGDIQYMGDIPNHIDVKQNNYRYPLKKLGLFNEVKSLIGSIEPNRPPLNKRVVYSQDVINKVNESARKRYHSDKQYALRITFTTLINYHLRKGNVQHSKKSTFDLLGYTVKELINHFEAKFNKGMSWDNYGSYWQVDHIKPASWFTYNSVSDDEFKECWSLDNLQPLEKMHNIAKSNNYAG